MRFSDEGLMLGVSTVLVAAGSSGRDILIDPRDPTLSALLTAAHLRRPTVGALAHLRKAAECWRGHEDAMAYMHLALSGLDRLERPDADAHRLFLADGLLKAGFTSNDIVGAVESGFPTIDPLDKYDPDQPRVPAGDGRTSGQWTSTGGDSDSLASEDANSEGTSPPWTAGSPVTTANAEANVPQPFVESTRSEVNPDTVTEVADPQYETPYACQVARAHCVEAAIEASEYDAANDNGPRNLDLSNCRKAAFACTAMSWAMQNQPLPFIGGGVRFPHGGVVLIYRDRVDRYVPPLQGGGTPFLRRRSERGREKSLTKVEKVDSYQFPPWKRAQDETIPLSSAGFRNYDKFVEAYSLTIHGSLTQKSYSLSKEWGRILRAKIAFEFASSPGTALLTCWARSGSDIRFDLTLECCVDCGAT
jgi:hypothetical protein